ncbi:MAG: xanthine dehydrogenase family protein subunit M [Proteobacteria bacterium]|nr:MAG: xanthine dehydrogenase family protein subunit M [Pseudomonadota bacterium]
MNSFTYARPNSANAAVGEITSQPGAKFIGGGTNLLDLMKEGVTRATRLVDVNHLPFKKIEKLDAGGIRIGALVTNSEVAYSGVIEKQYPLLASAILHGASPQLRNMATTGGNVLQRTRCYYFYDVTTPCNKRSPGSGCGAIHGVNRIHAVLGTSESCIATHPSDMCVALAALGAKVNVKGPAGDRTIEFKNFHRLPGDRPELDNTLQTEELITSIDLPDEDFSKNFYYLKLRDRASYAFALVSVAAALKMKDGVIEEARLAVGGVAHKPWRDEAAEALMKGQKPSVELFASVAQKVFADAKGFEHNRFKIELGKRAIVRAFKNALENPEIKP